MAITFKLVILLNFERARDIVYLLSELSKGKKMRLASKIINGIPLKIITSESSNHKNSGIGLANIITRIGNKIRDIVKMILALVVHLMVSTFCRPRLKKREEIQ